MRPPRQLIALLFLGLLPLSANASSEPAIARITLDRKAEKRSDRLTG
jgi:hypothetical protein